MIFVRTFWLQFVKFRCTVTSKTYFIKGKFSCDSFNVVYLITCSNCREQYVGSAINFKQRFRINKSDIKTNKDRFGTARYFNNKCCSPNNNHVYLKMQIIEQVLNNNQFSIEDLLWEREKFGRGNYALICMGWIILMIYITWERKAIENICFWTFNIFNDILSFWF